MSHYYGWSYATQLKPAKRVRPGKNRYKKPGKKAIVQKWQSASMAGPGMPLLNKSGRMIVALALIIISTAVLLKEPVLKSMISKQVQSWMAGIEKTNKINQGKNKSEQLVKVKKEEAIIDVGQLPKSPAPTLALIADQGLFMLDCLGQIWPMSHDQPVGSLPIITGLTVKEMPGEMGVVLKSEINFALVSKILNQRFAGQLSELHFKGHEVIIYTRDGIKVKINPDNNFNQNMIRLQAVLTDIKIKNKTIALIDMRYDQHIVVRPISRR